MPKQQVVTRAVPNQKVAAEGPVEMVLAATPTQRSIHRWYHLRWVLLRRGPCCGKGTATAFGIAAKRRPAPTACAGVPNSGKLQCSGVACIVWIWASLCWFFLRCNRGGLAYHRGNSQFHRIACCFDVINCCFGCHACNGSCDCYRISR